MTYSPRAGSIASRVIELLTARAPARMTSADICDEIDCEVQSFHPSIAMAISAGIVASEVRDDVHCYSLGDGIPLVVPPKVEDRPAPPQVDSAPKATPFKRWLKKKGQPTEEAPRKKPRAAKAPKPARKAKAKSVPKTVTKRAKPRKSKPVQAVVLEHAIAERSSTPSNGARHPAADLPASDLRCGFFNNGDLQLEVPGKKWCVLDRHELRDLVSYLRKLDQLSFSAMERAPT